jgi:DNA invertase Pin-like site-specific DNA recombinase
MARSVRFECQAKEARSMERSVLCVRVAARDQPKGSRNLGQLEMCRDYARGRGYHIVADLSEVGAGIGKRSMERPQLSRVLEMARAGEFDVLVVHRPDRLSRSLTEYVILAEELRSNGVRVEHVVLDEQSHRRAAALPE